MARHGPRLTPVEIATLAAAYASTGSYADAARAIGRDDPSVARKALLRLGSPSESQLHARACGRGLRLGRRRLVSAIDKVGDTLTSELASGSVEPNDIAALCRSLAALVTALARIDDRRDGAASERLRRQKLRTEIDLLQREGGLTVERLVAAIEGLSRDDKARLRDALRGAPTTPLTSSTPVAAHTSTAGDPPVPSEVAPAPR